jgi:UDP-glucose 4-epimerase
MARALITGGAGFIGSHVCDRFSASGYEVDVIDDLSTGAPANLGQRAVLHELDVCTAAAAEVVTSRRYDVLVHLAAQVDVRSSVQDPSADARTNILGALTILEAVRSLSEKSRPRVIFSSTAGVYGATAEFPTPESAGTNPDSPYATAKLSVEQYLAYYGRAWHLDTVTLRFANVYGPRQNASGEAGVIALFCKHIEQKEPLVIYGSGEQTRDFVFVADVADACLAAAKCDLPPLRRLDDRAFNIGTGVETSVLELVRALGRVAGQPPAVRHAETRIGEVVRSQLDPGKAARLLQWRPRTGLEDGLARTLAWVTT